MSNEVYSAPPKPAKRWFYVVTYFLILLAAPGVAIYANSRPNLTQTPAISSFFWYVTGGWLLLGILLLCLTPMRSHQRNRKWDAWRRQTEIDFAAHADSPTIPAVYIGGHGAPLEEGEHYYVRFESSEISVRSFRDNAMVWQTSLKDVVSFEVSGRGSFQTGGGFVGGGFGARGAAEGIAVAAVLNSLTTKDHREAILQIQTLTSSTFLYDFAHTPDSLKVLLSRPFDQVSLRERPREDLPRAVNQPSSDVAEKLVILRDLHASGQLTDAEFTKAKSVLLNDDRDSIS